MNSIIQSIYDEPEKWKVGAHQFTHENGVLIWIASGFLFYEAETGGSFTLWQKVKLRKAYRWWLDNAPMEAMGNA